MICSDNNTYLKRMEELKHHLVNCGYNRVELQCQIDRATIVSRSKHSQRVRITTDTIPLVVTCHPDLAHLSKISMTIYPLFTSQKK